MRANRIHHRERMRRRAVFIARRVWQFGSNSFRRDDIVERKRRSADTFTGCSCSMCCNPRRSGYSKAGGKTPREIRVEREVSHYRREFGVKGQ